MNNKIDICERKQFITNEYGDIEYKSDLISDPLNKIKMFCPSCPAPVICCCGDIRPNYLRHKSNTRNGCTYYDDEIKGKGKQSQANDHDRNLCSKYLKKLIEDKQIIITQEGKDGLNEYKDLHKLQIRIMYKYTYEDNKQTTAHLALLENGEVKYVIEFVSELNADYNYKKDINEIWFKFYYKDVKSFPVSYLEAINKIKPVWVLKCRRSYSEIYYKRIQQEMEDKRIKQIKLKIRLEYIIKDSNYSYYKDIPKGAFIKVLGCRISPKCIMLITHNNIYSLFKNEYLYDVIKKSCNTNNFLGNDLYNVCGEFTK